MAGLSDLFQQAALQFQRQMGVPQGFTTQSGAAPTSTYVNPNMGLPQGTFNPGEVLDSRVGAGNNNLFDIALGNRNAGPNGTAPTTPTTLANPNGTKPMSTDNPAARTNSAGELSPEFKQPTLAGPYVAQPYPVPNGQPTGSSPQGSVVTSSPNPQGSNGSVVTNTYGGGGGVPSGGGGSGIGSINTGGSVATHMAKGGMANSVAGGNPAGYDYHNDPNYAHATTTSMNKGGANAAGNPQGQVQRAGYNQQTGWLTLPDGTQLNDRLDPRIWGQTGGNIWGNPDQYPQYFQEVPNTDSEGGGPPRYELKPEVAARLNGRIQIGQAGVGGGGEVHNPNMVEYDPEFGFLTDPRNIKPPNQSYLQRAIGPIIMAAFGGAAGLAGAGVGNMVNSAAAGTGLEGAVSLANTGRQIYGAANTVNNLVNPRGKIGYKDAADADSGVGSSSDVGSSGPYQDLTNGGRNNNLDTSNSTGSSDVTSFLGDIIPRVIAGNQDNHAGQDYRARTNELLDRGDPYGANGGQNRQRAIQRLADLENDPSSIYKSPTFIAAQQAIDDAIRARGAATGNMASGREMVDLADAMRSHGEQAYNNEWQRTAREAGVFFDPSSMAGRAMGANDTNYRATTNRNAANANGFTQALQNSPAARAAYEAIRNGTATQAVVNQFQQWYRNIFGDSSGGVPNVSIDNPLDTGFDFENLTDPTVDFEMPDFPDINIDYGDGYDWTDDPSSYWDF